MNETVATYRVLLHGQTAEYVEVLQATAADEIIQICLSHDQATNHDKSCLFREVFKVVQAVIEEINSAKGF